MSPTKIERPEVYLAPVWSPTNKRVTLPTPVPVKSHLYDHIPSVVAATTGTDVYQAQSVLLCVCLDRDMSHSFCGWGVVRCVVVPLSPTMINTSSTNNDLTLVCLHGCGCCQRTTSRLTLLSLYVIVSCVAQRV